MPTPPTDALPGAITTLLDEARNGRAGAMDELFALVYDDLRALAQHHADGLAGGDEAARAAGPGDLDGTALVHAACARLLNTRVLSAENRRHFFFLFLRAMNDTLVEQARFDLRRKRGGDWQRQPHVEQAADDFAVSTDIADLRAALAELAVRDPDGAQVVMLRFFAGRTLREAAEIMGCTLAAARNHWDYARAWLLERMEAGGSA